MIMTPDLRGVKAAPNRCEIKARILNMRQDSKYSDKWNLELKVLETKNLIGPNFARVGDEVKGFAFESTSKFFPQSLSTGSIITVQAEFVGDERGGKFRIQQIDAIESK